MKEKNKRLKKRGLQFSLFGLSVFSWSVEVCAAAPFVPFGVSVLKSGANPADLWGYGTIVGGVSIILYLMHHKEKYPG